MKEENKSEILGDFVDITLASKETKEKPTQRFINQTTATLKVGDYIITFDVSNLNRVLEMLGYD